MTSFKRWFGAGAIVLVALALVACPALVPEPVGKISPMTFTVGDDPKMISDVDDLFTNTDDRSKFNAESSDKGKATASVSGTTLTVTPVAEGEAEVTLTATLSNGKTAATSFMVTVKAKPVIPPPVVDTQNDGPRMYRDLPDLDDLMFGADVAPDPIDLSMYFRDDEGDAITYTAVSDDTNVVRVGMSGTDMDMLTITVVSASGTNKTTTIHVTARDEHGLSVTESFDVTVINEAPMPTDVNAQLSLSMVSPHHMSEVDLTRHFTDREGDGLTYSVHSVMPEGVLMASVSDGSSPLMLTAVKAGTATVTVHATDGMSNGDVANDPASKDFRVVVTDVPNQAPMVKGDGIPDQSLTLAVMDGMESATKEIDLSDYFEDPDDMPMSPLMYSDDSDMTMIEDSMLTITADDEDSGMTMTITVTASDGADSITDMFDVMVMAPAAPTWKKEIPDVTFEYDGEPQTFMLADYFNHATMYATDHGDGTVVMAGVSDDRTLTLTRVGAGSAVVEITPSNSGGSGTTQSITVTVEAAASKPTEKMGMTIPTMIKVTATNADTADQALDLTDDDVAAAFNAAEKHYKLRDYIKDPVGPDADLVFSTETTDPKIAAVYATPPDADDPADGDADERAATTTAILDKMMTDSPDITIRGRKAGMATVTITATGDGGREKSWEIAVTVADSNTGPSRTTDAEAEGFFPGTDAEDENFGKFVNVDGASRIKSDATMWKQKLDLGLIFEDPDIDLKSRGDSWTLKAMSDKKEIVTAMLESTNNAQKPHERYVMLTPVKSGDAMIYFTAEDSFGMKAGGYHDDDDDPDTPNVLLANTFFSVKVNNRPMAQGGQEKEPLMLANAKETMNLVVSETAVEVRLVDDETTTDTVEGYFSDKDEDDDLLCRYGGLSAGGVATVSWLAGSEREVLSVVAVKEGTATVQVWCYDQVGPSGSEVDFEMSDKATLTIDVIAAGSTH